MAMAVQSPHVPNYSRPLPLRRSSTNSTGPSRVALNISYQIMDPSVMASNSRRRQSTDSTSSKGNKKKAKLQGLWEEEPEQFGIQEIRLDGKQVFAPNRLGVCSELAETKSTEAFMMDMEDFLREIDPPAERPITPTPIFVVSSGRRFSNILLRRGSQDVDLSASGPPPATSGRRRSSLTQGLSKMFGRRASATPSLPMLPGRSPQEDEEDDNGDMDEVEPQSVETWLSGLREKEEGADSRRTADRTWDSSDVRQSEQLEDEAVAASSNGNMKTGWEWGSMVNVEGVEFEVFGRVSVK